ncbi:MAG: carbohydrate kinase family protein [Leifsonia sp.]
MGERVVIVGPASWNRIVYLDRLPEPVPHMQFALEDYETIGGTSAGKALGLVSLGRSVLLHTAIGTDADGLRVRGALSSAGIEILLGDETVTERHLNLMTRAGERVSLYLSSPGAPEEDAPVDGALAAALADAPAIVLDLSAPAAALIPAARSAGAPVWTDIHDYDGDAAFHRPFIDAADAIFMNADRIGDPLPFMERCIRDGARLVVCTLGAAGAIAVDERMLRHEVAAVPVEVLDTNGAGDAFMSGVLDARLGGADIQDALRAGARHAATVLTTRHLHPALDAVL